MSQGQPQRPQSDHESVTYGDVFGIGGNIASQAVAPGDAAIMLSAENQMLVQAASGINVATGAVDPDSASDAVLRDGVSITREDIDDIRIVTQRVGGQVIGQYVDPRGAAQATEEMENITIGEALEAASFSAAADKPIDHSDAAAIKAAEVRAIGSNATPAGGIGAQAQSAADLNARASPDENKTTLSDVLADAAAKLPKDKTVTREDAQGVIGAEIRNKSDLMTTAGGVAASMAAAARFNQS